MDLHSEFILAFTLLYQINFGYGFVLHKKLMDYNDDKIIYDADKILPVSIIVRNDNIKPIIIHEASAPESENNEQNADPLILMPVVQETVPEPDDLYPVLPLPYPIAFANYQENLQFVPAVNNLQESYLHVDNNAQYIPLQVFQQPEILPYQYYSIEEQPFFHPVTAKPAEPPILSVENGVQINSFIENKNELLSQVMDSKNGFINNKTNFDNIRIYNQSKNISSSTAQQVNNTTAELETTTFSGGSPAYSTPSTNHTDDNSRMKMPVKINLTNGSTESTQRQTVATKSLPSRHIIKAFIDENGNPCVQEMVTTHLKTFYVFTCEEKGIIKTTTPKSNVIHFTNELTTTMATTELQVLDTHSKNSSTNSISRITSSGIELNDFSFLTYE